MNKHGTETTNARRSHEVKRLLLRSDETPENFTGRITFMSMFNDISCGSKDKEKECLANAKLLSLHAKRLWSFVGPGSEKKWYCISEDSPQGVWDNMAERVLLDSAESDSPICRALQVHSPEVNSKAKDMENCRYTLWPTRKRLTFFSQFSANQLCLYGAIAEMCEEYYEPFMKERGDPL